MRFAALLSVFCLVFLLPSVSFAQANMEDVVYLNNGSVLRGIIIEQVPNKSLKVQILGGSIFHVEISDVTRITKETVMTVPPSLRERSPEANSLAPRDSVPGRTYQFRPKGYFFQAQLLVELVQGGLRIINGYRFGRFGHLGIGVGIDRSGSSLSNASSMSYDNDYNVTNRFYFPIFLHYSGEILKTRVTPFYAIEAGYAAALDGSGIAEYDSYGSDEVRGGAMWGLGIGVRFKSKRRVNFSLLLNVNAKNVSYREYYYQYDEFGQSYYTQSNRVNTTLVYPGLRLGIGF